MKLTKFLVTMLMGLLAVEAFAQTFTLRGTVEDQLGGVAGAVVMEVGNQTNGVITNGMGEFTITVPVGSQIKVSFVGYKEEIVSVTGKNDITITLTEDTEFLDEVLVVGYGTQKKEFVVGSVSQVSSKDLLKAPNTSVQSMLTGKLSGFTNIQTSGMPGDEQTKMLVRGYSTFNSSSPLIIVDGVERPITYLNPNDIASVTVLKDAATAAIYGVRGGNGVLLVTTKSGVSGDARISYDGSATFSTNTAVPEICNAEQFIYYHNKARELDGLDPIFTPENIQKLKDQGLYGETNYLDEIYNKFGFTHQHNISASGGNEKVRYFTSIGLMNQDGILKKTSYDRYNIRSNVEATLVDGLTFSLNMAGTYSNRLSPGAGGYSVGMDYDSQNSTKPTEFNPITQAYYAIPILKPYTDDGKAIGYMCGTYTRTPVSALLDSGEETQRRYGLESSAKLQYAVDNGFMKGLKMSVFAAFNYDATADRSFLTPFDVVAVDDRMNMIAQLSEGIDESNFSRSNSFAWNMTVRPQIDYSRTFGDHSISALGLFERYKYYGDTMTAYAKGFYSDTLVDISLGTNSTYVSPSASYRYTGFASFAGQFNYAYKEKYLLGLTVRRDGSYKFAPEYRWGTFPSVALGWIMSKEDFFDGLKGTVDFLKLRASYGELGSDDTDAYLYMQLFYPSTNAAVIGGEAQSAFFSSGYVHEGLTWSHTKSYNVGFESHLFNNKLSVEFDWFYKYTDRILEADSTGTYAPSLGGNNPTWLNTGKMDNRGFELNVRHDNWFSNGFSYNVTGILSWSHNRVLSRRITDNHPSYRKILGESLGTVYGYHALGLFQTQEEIDNYAAAPSGWLELGALMYEDVNGDGKIDYNHDYVKIASSSVPEMTFSLNFEANYKNFSVSALFQGATMCDYLLSGAYNNTTDNSYFTRSFYGNGNSILYLCEDGWTPENTDARYPRLSTKVNGNNSEASDWWVIDGTYLRLKTLQFSYALPKKLASAIKANAVRVNLSGTNIFTLSNFKYLDPENPGVNNGYYPQQRTVSLGLNLTF